MNELIERLRKMASIETSALYSQRKTLLEAAAALASPTPGGVVKPTEDAVERAAKALAACDYWAWPAPGHLQQTYRDKARAALEAASSPAPGEPVALPSAYDFGLTMQRARDAIAQGGYEDGNAFLDEACVWLDEALKAWADRLASPPASPPEPPQGVLEALKEMLLHEEPGAEFSDRVQRARAAIANAERSPLPLGDA